MTKKWLIDRRTLLRGAGATLALPLLETMGWAEPAAAKIPIRLGWMYHANGVNQKAFWPATPASWPNALPSSLEPLKPVLGECLLLDGIDNLPRDPFGGAAHAVELSAWLTAWKPDPAKRDQIAIAPSADQIAAEQLGAFTALPSLELGTRANERTGTGQEGLNNRYYTTGSFRSATQPLPVMVNPAEVYKRLFSARGGGKGGGPMVDVDGFAGPETAPAAGGEPSLDRSMLDLVRESANDLKKRVSKDDQAHLDEYLENMRALEKRVAAIERQQRASVVKSASAAAASTSSIKRSPPLEVKIPTGEMKWSEHVRVLGDLLVLAFQTDITRVGTLIGTMNHGIRYPELGMTEAHHDVSHHQNDPAKLALVAKIDRFNLEQFAYVVGRMKSLKEGSGTLLDNMIFMWGAALGDGDSHTHKRLPTIIAGKGGGTVKTGRYVPNCQGNLGDLLTAILARAGVKLPKPIGCGTKMLPDLS